MILDIKGISKSFGGVKALEGCSMQIRPGKITAVIGPNGSGKSTLFNVISGLVPADKGQIRLGEQVLSGEKEHNIAKQGIARTFQDVRLFKNLTIDEHVRIALSEQDEEMLAGIFGKVSEEGYEKKVREVLDLVGLDKPLKTLATDLSYGQRKLLDLGVAIAKPHKVLMLDEPVAGVNPRLRGTIKQVLLNLKKKGETVLLIEHDMNFVMDLADEVYVLDAGKVISQGTPAKVRKDKKVLEAYLGD